MPRAPPALTRGLSRFVPILRPLAIGGGTTAGLLAGGYVIKQAGQARNPPLQRQNFDTDPTRPGYESSTLTDTKTGRTYTFGASPTDKGDNERSEERTQQLLIWGGIAAVVAIVVLRGA